MGDLSSAERLVVGCYELSLTSGTDTVRAPRGMDSLRLDSAYAEPFLSGGSPGRRVALPPFRRLPDRHFTGAWWRLRADSLLISRGDGLSGAVFHGTPSHGGFRGLLSRSDDVLDGAPDPTWSATGRRIDCPPGGEPT